MNRTEATRGVSKSGEGEGHGEQSGPSGFLCVYDARGGVRLITDVRPVSSVPRRQEPPGPWVHSGLEHDGDLHRVLNTVLLSEPRERKEQHDSSDQSKFCIRAVS